MNLICAWILLIHVTQTSITDRFMPNTHYQLIKMHFLFACQKTLWKNQIILSQYKNGLWTSGQCYFKLRCVRPLDIKSFPCVKSGCRTQYTGCPKKNALSESSCCKLTRQRDPLRLLGACKPGLWAWMDCRTAMMILKVRFFWDTLYMCAHCAEQLSHSVNILAEWSVEGPRGNPTHFCKQIMV